MTSKLKKIFPKMKEEFMFTRPVIPNDKKRYAAIDIAPSPISGELVSVPNSKLPQAIVFNPIPLPAGDYTAIANLYTHIVNPLYMGGQCEETTLAGVLATISTMEYVFSHRIEYYLIVLVQSCIYKMKDRFRDIDELKLYRYIMSAINRDFGNIIYCLKYYIGDDATISKDTISHMIISMDAEVYNCLLDSLIGYPLNPEDHAFITSLVCEFDMIIFDYFNDYILREVETIYRPQLEAALEKGIELDNLEEGIF